MKRYTKEYLKDTFSKKVDSLTTLGNILDISKEIMEQHQGKAVNKRIEAVFKAKISKLPTISCYYSTDEKVMKFFYNGYTLITTIYVAHENIIANLTENIQFNREAINKANKVLNNCDKIIDDYNKAIDILDNIDKEYQNLLYDTLKISLWG